MSVYECGYTLIIRDDSRIFVAANSFADAEEIFRDWADVNRIRTSDKPYQLCRIQEVTPHFVSTESMAKMRASL